MEEHGARAVEEASQTAVQNTVGNSRDDAVLHENMQTEKILDRPLHCQKLEFYHLAIFLYLCVVAF